ncbi:MAG: phenylalanine--tRNA ligase subunit alpha [Myxococcales bacterium]|nr:phenylalanine--tRNA ligase subunit alpha [Myxococcales bacterium]
MPDVESLLRDFRADLSAVTDPAHLDEVKRRHTGKKSPLKAAFKELRSVPDADRPAVAAAINAAKATMEAEVEQAAQRVQQQALARQLQAEWQDLTLPGLAPHRGARHPITQVERRAMQMLRQLGFEVVDGPEVEHPWYNFDALNIPEHHPARDMQDTFWVTGGWLLRSHTTTVQARVLEERPELPIKIASIGRVYRNEAVDATHTAMFHQFEGLWVEPGLTFAHLKGVLAFVARTLYGSSRRIRFKPKFYPYTEPSIGMDLACVACDGSGQSDGGGCGACHGAGWLTVLGAGMVHPKVFETFGFDHTEVTGIAFGLGTTRLGAQWAGVSKSATLYEQDLRVHETMQRGTP